MTKYGIPSKDTGLVRVPKFLIPGVVKWCLEQCQQFLQNPEPKVFKHSEKRREYWRKAQAKKRLNKSV